ncbi:MAG: transglycosylase domain-containing protein [Mycobacteriales bacterium]
MPTWRQVLVSVLGGIALVALFLVIGYITTTVPNPSTFAVAQTTVVYASDGHTVLGRFGAVNRTDVALSKVPVTVQHEVLAAEDRHYYSEPGISITGMLRALYVDVTGGSLAQGGSTITQQYTKNAFLTQQRTFSRKIREVFIAVKLDHTESKSTVLHNYLNTIYFGRGVYGIQAAARAYFGVDVSRLDAAQGAVLAGLIDAPSIYDPYVDASAARARWQYVLSGMVAMHWLSPARAAALRYPHVLPPKPAQVTVGPSGFILDQVKLDLAAHGFPEARLAAGGYRVYTTIDPKAQQAAITAENQLHAKVGKPVSALVSVQPGNGAIRAWYGGRVYDNPKVAGSFIDLATVREQPGSSFKPYTLITALEQGMGLNTTFNGYSPMTIPGYGVLHNASNETCVPCTLTEALARSINTVFVPLAIKVGPANVRRTARAAGVNEPLVGKRGYPEAGIAIGIYPVTPLDQATGFATIAAQGIYARPYLVAKVVTSGGRVVYQAHPQTRRVFSAAVASNVIYAMEQVLTNPAGTAYGKALANGRPAAGKTGTATNPANQDTNDWFIGFTPQLSTAVWMGNLNGSALVNRYGVALFGGGPPATAWQTFMNLALANAPIVQFPPPAPIGGQNSIYTPSPTPSASPSPRPKRASPTPSPRPSPSLLPTPASSPSPSPYPSPTGPAPLPSLTTSASPQPSPSASPGGSSSPAPG